MGLLPNFVTDNDVLTAVKSVLGVLPTDTISAEWPSIISAANNSATGDIYERLSMLGFLPSSIANWDQAPQYALDQATYWSLVRGAGLGSYSAPQLEHLDRRKELLTKTVLIVDGIPTAVTPGQSDVGGITHGVTAGSGAAAAQFNRFSSGNCCLPQWGQNRCGC